MIQSQAKSNMKKIHADFSKKFLVFGFGILVVLFEIAVAKWTLFYTAAPMLSLCYIFTLLLLRPQFMSTTTVILLALLFELMGGDMLGVRITAFYLATLVVKNQLGSNQIDDFISHWANFSLICFGVVLFKLIVFFALYLTMPNLSMLAFQIGITVLVFPIFFVSVSVLFSFFEAPINKVD